MKHKFKEKCDSCGKWSRDFVTMRDLDGQGLIVCEECKDKVEKILMERLRRKGARND